MKASTVLATSVFANSVLAMSIPNLWARATVTVYTDTGSTDVDVSSDISGTAELTSSRGGSNRLNIASVVYDIVSKVTKSVLGMIDDDIQRRMAFTKDVAAQTRTATAKNVIVSNVGYSLDSPNSNVTSTDYNAKVGSDVSFDVIVFETGTFILKGDGGYQNWAYVVDGTCTANGGTITC